MTNIDPARSATTAAQTPTVFVPVLGSSGASVVVSTVVGATVVEAAVVGASVVVVLVVVLVVSTVVAFELVVVSAGVFLLEQPRRMKLSATAGMSCFFTGIILSLSL